MSKAFCILRYRGDTVEGGTDTECMLGIVVFNVLP